MKNHPESEQLIIATLHLYNEYLDKVMTILPEPEMFSHYFYQELYREMLALHAEGQAFDLLSIADRLGRTMASVIDLLAITENMLMVNEPKILTHARLVAEAYVRRQVEEATKRGDDAAALMERIAGLQQRGTDRFFNPTELAMLAFAEATMDHERLSYPFGTLQQASGGGMRKDELVIVAGRPGTGKTAWLLQHAWHLAKQGQRILFASAEMSAQSLMLRLASHIAKRNLFSIKTDEERELLNEALELVTKSGFHIIELTEVEQLAAHLRGNSAYGAVFVDYLQQLHTKAAGKGEFELVTAVTRQLDAMSMQYHLPFVVASQFSRNAEGQQPSMASLRSSGQIEQAADVIVSLWSKAEEQADPSKAKVYMDILKNRNGYTVINGLREYALIFNKPTFTFHEIEQRMVSYQEKKLPLV